MKAIINRLMPMALALLISLPVPFAAFASELDSDAIFQYQAKTEIKKYTFENETYGTDEINIPLKGWVAEDDLISYYENGKMVTGFQEIDGKTYYFNEEGILLSGEVTIDGKTYTLTQEGELRTGWDEDKNQYYSEDGSLVVSQRIKIGKTTYLFDEDGYLVTNETVDGYEYDARGKGTRLESPYDTIAQAALAQLGVMQDCTRLVSNSLLAVGIDFHGAPYKYAALGEWTNEPVPGDICIYSGHVAIYIGDGMAVHGGWNGGTTAIYTVECSAPFIGYIHVNEDLMNLD